MKRFGLLLGIVVIALPVSHLSAAPGTHQNIYLGPLLKLIANPAVLRDLRIRESQFSFIQSLQIDLRREVRMAMPPHLLAAPSPSGKQATRLPPPSASVQRAVGRADEVARQLLDLILDKQQRLRLEQLLLQAEGPEALKRASFRKRIGISDAEYATLVTLVEQWSKVPRSDADRLESEIMKLVPEGPRGKWNELIGKPLPQ